MPLNVRRATPADVRVIVEYNCLFGATRSVSVPYDAAFRRTHAHPSNLYYGASLTAFQSLLHGRGYALVGVNKMGSNAFFVKRELLNERVTEVGVEQCFRMSTFREARSAKGELTFRSALESRDELGHLPIVDLSSGRLITINDLFVTS